MSSGWRGGSASGFRASGPHRSGEKKKKSSCPLNEPSAAAAQRCAVHRLASPPALPSLQYRVHFLPLALFLFSRIASRHRRSCSLNQNCFFPPLLIGARLISSRVHTKVSARPESACRLSGSPAALSGEQPPAIVRSCSFVEEEGKKMRRSFVFRQIVFEAQLARTSIN